MSGFGREEQDGAEEEGIFVTDNNEVLADLKMTGAAFFLLYPTCGNPSEDDILLIW